MKLIYNYLLVLIFYCFNVNGRTSEDLKVTLPHGGTLIGRYLTSHSGRGIRGFLGIPYAKPPINELRFKAPVPAPSWNGEMLAVKDSSICIQRDPFRRDLEIQGSEDCLYLNVYTPQGINKTSELLPVMVFFHGGGWICGSGISAFYGPEYLMDHDIVYVSGNFRLGPLGFLSTETSECPGNNGLKDQSEILRWIQKNIASFGGNPKSVTIFGESAGGASVTYHMMSPASKGLFHKAISQSGTYFNPWAAPAHKGVAASTAAKLAKILNCYSEDKNWIKILNCLREKPAESITATLYDLFKWDFDPMITFPPVVEVDSPDAFITKHPRNEKFPHGLNIPWMAGITSDEGTLKTAPLLGIPGLLENFKENFNKVLPICLYYDHLPVDTQNIITRKINDFYFKGIHEWCKNNHQNLTNLFTDAWFLSGFDEYLRRRLETSNQLPVAPSYVYLFDHKGAASFTEIFHGDPEHFYGVCHAEELQYLFPIGKSLFVTATPSKQDDEIRSTIVKLWTNFAKYGNPTPSEDYPVKWEPSSKYPVKYIRFGSKSPDDWKVMQTEEGLFENRINFWNQLNSKLGTFRHKDEL